MARKTINRQLVRETSRQSKSPESKIQSVIDFVGEYTAKIIRNGGLDTVVVPYFGKFEAKIRQVKIVDALRGRAKINIPK